MAACTNRWPKSNNKLWTTIQPFWAVSTVTGPAEQQQWLCGAKQLVLRSLTGCSSGLWDQLSSSSALSCPSKPRLSSGKWSPGRDDDQKIHIKYHSWPETLCRHRSTHCFGLTGCFIKLLSCSFINLSPLYIVKSHLLPVTQTAALTALLACPHPEKKVFFTPDLTEEQHAVRQDTTQAPCLHLCLPGT